KVSSAAKARKYSLLAAALLPLGLSEVLGSPRITPSLPIGASSFSGGPAAIALLEAKAMLDFQEKCWMPCLLLLATLGSGALWGCGSKSEPAVAETKKFRPVDDSSPDAAAAAPSALADSGAARAGFASRRSNAASAEAAEAAPPGPTAQGAAI